MVVVVGFFVVVVVVVVVVVGFVFGGSSLSHISLLWWFTPRVHKVVATRKKDPGGHG